MKGSPCLHWCVSCVYSTLFFVRDEHEVGQINMINFTPLISVWSVLAQYSVPAMLQHSRAMLEREALWQTALHCTVLQQSHHTLTHTPSLPPLASPSDWPLCSINSTATGYSSHRNRKIPISPLFPYPRGTTKYQDGTRVQNLGSRI